MSGWSSAAARRDSCSKRARKPAFAASSGASSFSATLRPRPDLLGAVDDAHPASPDHRLEPVTGELRADARVGRHDHLGAVTRLPLGRGPLGPAPSLRPPLARRALRAREVAVAGLDRHRLLALEVAHAPTPRFTVVSVPSQRSCGQPDRPAHRGRAVLAGRAELALAVAPQLAEHRLRAPSSSSSRRRRRARALERRALRPRRLALEDEVGDQRLRLLRLLLGHRLLDLEDPVVEVRRLRLRRPCRPPTSPRSAPCACRAASRSGCSRRP